MWYLFVVFVKFVSQESRACERQLRALASAHR